MEELKEAKENHTPEMKHFMGLERKIKQMEMRHRQREQELQQVKQGCVCDLPKRRLVGKAGAHALLQHLA